MRTFLKILFCFLLITQICFAQLYPPQSSKVKLNIKSGITDRMDKHHKKMVTNIHSSKNNQFSTPKLNNKLPSEIDPSEVNNTSNPFPNDRLIPDGSQENMSPIIRMLSSQSQFYVIDTAVVHRLGDDNDPGDTTRHLYTFNASAKMTSGLTQKLIGDTWVNISRLTNEYDDANNMLSYLYEFWENGQLVYSYRYTYTYDAQGNMLSFLIEDWGNGQWGYSHRYTYTYDAQGNMLLFLHEFWENGQWVYSSRGTYTYDAQGNMLSELWEWQSGQWVNTHRRTYTYDTHGNMLSDLYEYWENGQWVYSLRYTYTYDAQGNMLSDLYEYWENGQWVYSTRYTFTYDAQGNRLLELFESWQGQWWAIIGRVIYTYDAQGNMLSELHERWLGQWVNTFRVTFTYDAQGCMTSVWSYIWQNSTWTPIDFIFELSDLDNAGNYYDLGRGYNFTFSYKMMVTGVESEENVPGTNTLSQNYPNPFNPNTKIKYSIPKSSQVIVKIFNTLGQEIETLVNEEKLVGTYELNWNAANLPSGVYFYRLKAGSFVQTRKMILAK